MSLITIEAPGPRPTDRERAALAEADVITGIDVQSQREFTLFGTPPLESTATLKRPSAMRVVQVRIDGSPAALERLIKLVRDLKSADG
jgi:hypothetical protein